GNQVAVVFAVKGRDGEEVNPRSSELNISPDQINNESSAPGIDHRHRSGANYLVLCRAAHSNENRMKAGIGLRFRSAMPSPYVSQLRYDEDMSRSRRTTTQMVHARVEPKLKSAAEQVFAELGLSTTEAIRLFLKQVQLHRGLPFPVSVPNKETIAAMAE